jgi:hypothetical protein
MRLPFMKGVHADLSGTAWQEIGVKPCFACPGKLWGMIGIRSNPQQSEICLRNCDS